MEILASELRIGNWFQQDASNNNTISRFFTVDEIKRYGVRSTYIRQDTNQPHTSLFSLDSIHPIPLTPEILEKCGFVMLHHLGKIQPTFQIDSSFELHWANGILYLTFSQDNYDENIDLSEFIIERALPHIQYLHQLQNLYFALTGEELTYTP
jgi:hypothetical protein